MKKIKILMVLGNTGRGGAQTFAINVLRMIDKEIFQVDFAINELKDNGYSNEMRALGSKIYVIPFFKGYNWRIFVKAWDKLLTENQYDIIHGNVSSSASIYLKEARRHGCKTVLHSHSSGYRGNKIIRIIKKVFTLGAKKQADYWFACSKLAAIRLFGNKYANYEHYYDIPNAIVANDYLFSEKKRRDVRDLVKIEPDQKLYGHVGSFTAAKNHDFLLEVFLKILDKDSNAVLVLCGEGERESAIKEKVISLNISEKVVFVGNVSNVNEYMMAIDAMIFPSFFEGFPITILEAQATGLPIVLSNTITKEVFLTNCVHPMSLNDVPEKWAEKLISLKDQDRVSMNKAIENSKYNMKNSIKLLERIYCEMVVKRCVCIF